MDVPPHLQKRMDAFLRKETARQARQQEKRRSNSSVRAVRTAVTRLLYNADRAVDKTAGAQINLGSERYEITIKKIT
jgi:hypothetical protein